jgi:hypothetical protein
MHEAQLWLGASVVLAAACARVHLVGFLYVLVATAFVLTLAPPPAAPPPRRPRDEENDAVSSRLASGARTANPRKAGATTPAAEAPRRFVHGVQPPPPTSASRARFLEAFAKEAGLL